MVIQNSEIFSIPANTILKLRSEYQEISDLQIMILTRVASYHWGTRRMLYLKTAQERYEWFLERYPGLNYDIASFLNITPVTLSRIRHDKE